MQWPRLGKNQRIPTACEMTGTIQFAYFMSTGPMRTLQLSAAAKNRIGLAEARLRLDVEFFLLACSKEEMRPNPIFLEPYFERYALTVLKESAASLLRGMASPESAVVVQEHADTILDEICGQDGLWSRVVEESFEKANLIHLGNSRIGYHPDTEFIRPRKRAIKEALRLQVLRWQTEALDRQPTYDRRGNVKVRVQTVAVPKAHSAVTESRQPHPDPESILAKHPMGVNKATAAMIFGISGRRVEQLIKDGELETKGRGHVKLVTTHSILESG